MIASLGKQGGRRYGQLRDVLIDARQIGAPASAAAPPAGAINFRRTLSTLGTRAGERQLHKGA